VAEHDQPEHRPSEPSAAEPSSIDPEQLRQFQQFQQFQEFQRFQEAQRRQAAKPPSPRDWRSFLRWLITRRLVRRLLRLAIIILLVLFALWLAIDYYFGGSNSSSSNTQGEASRRSQNPKDAVLGIYTAVANNLTSGCLLFTPDARSAFARDLGADTCEHAVQQAASKVQNKSSYVPDARTFPDLALSGDVTISSCTLSVQGGERLGKFVLHKESDGGWIISKHYNEACATG
jgi:hypothetical protein